MYELIVVLDEQFEDRKIIQFSEYSEIAD